MQHESTCHVCGADDWSVACSGIRDWEYGVEGEFAYRRCGSCSVLQIHPFPDVEDLIRAYSVDYHGYRTSAEKGKLYKLLFELKDKRFRKKALASIPRGAAMLDVGCGSGEYLARLEFLEPARRDGIDFNEKAVRLARQKGIDCYQGIFTDFPAEPETYDVVFMNNYLEHTLSPREELEQAVRVLKPGGQLIGEVPNFRSLDQKLFGKYWGGNHVPRHTFQFEPKPLEKLLADAGFGDVRTKQELSTNHFTLSFQNFWQRREPDLARNPSLTKGRAWYYNQLLIALLPVNVINVLCGQSGVMKFFATR